MTLKVGDYVIFNDAKYIRENKNVKLQVGKAYTIRDISAFSSNPADPLITLNEINDGAFSRRFKHIGSSPNDLEKALYGIE